MDCGNPQYIEYIVLICILYFKKKKVLTINQKGLAATAHPSRTLGPRLHHHVLLRQRFFSNTVEIIPGVGRKQKPHWDVMGKSDMVVYNITYIYNIL